MSNVGKKNNSKNSGKKTKTSSQKPQKKTCLSCPSEDAEKLLKFFYRSSNPIHADGYVPICKDCIRKISYDYEKDDVDIEGLKSVLRQIDRPYIEKVLQSSINQYNKQNKGREDYIGNKVKIIGNYFKNIQSFSQYNTMSWMDGIEWEEEEKKNKRKDVVFTGVLSKENSSDNNEVSVTKVAVERWGMGFNPEEVSILEDHYKMLKKQNPNCDSNQEIFIKDLCYIKLQQLQSMKVKSTDDFGKLTKLYRDTFKQAGLKTIQEIDSSSEETLGVTLAVISQYTPEEYYKDKKLYKDFDGLGSYFSRFIKRPLKNLMVGSKERDPEYNVDDSDDGDG